MVANMEPGPEPSLGCPFILRLTEAQKTRHFRVFSEYSTLAGFDPPAIEPSSAFEPHNSADLPTTGIICASAIRLGRNPYLRIWNN